MYGAQLSTEKAIECDIKNTSKSTNIGEQGIVTTATLERYVIASSKITEPVDFSTMANRLKLTQAQKIQLAEDTLKTYQRVAPTSHAHQLKITDYLITTCKQNINPIKHGRALGEKARLLRFGSDKPEVFWPKPL